MTTYTLVRIELKTDTIEEAQARILRMLEYHKLYYVNKDMNYTIGTPTIHDTSKEKPVGRPK